MNYYGRHIGDYLKDAAHLSLLEHGIYTRLLDVYYIRESALPSASVARLIGARSKDELAALNVVLAEFFVLTDAGEWLQSRCEVEILCYQKKASHNREVGKLGGRPRKTETQEKPIGLILGSDKEPEPNPSHKPLANNHKPKEKEQEKPTSPASPWLTLDNLVKDGLSPELGNAWISHRRTRKAKLTALAWDGFKTEARKADWTLEAAVLKAIARNWTAFEAVWVANELTGRGGAPPLTFRERDAANAAARIHEMTGGLVSAKPVSITRRNDALQEVFDAIPSAKRLG